ncbi:tlyc1 [Scardovia inopinata]|uniref:YggT family protein n=1 Tax=Scardovia inopinata F0304 TaxID=641146 RepID=W5IIW6_SCAIO|nr:YggT family protein [Scardovia inopinata]EFG26775.1 hypothetical protein HMPREF9020_00402 [Scardovia inopinata F0304]BAR06378.1 conserved hypothetical protein [Scardovia inopinata JCM 12537]SUV51895.1 tlyc1 [Scardovia inopinata]
MLLVTVILRILRIFLSAFLFILTVRMILDWVALLTRWQPGKIMYPLVNAVYTVTEPPLRLMRKIIPPLRMGLVALDLGFMVLYFAVSFLIAILP